MGLAFLEDFEAAERGRGGRPKLVPEADLAVARAEGFDEGYRAGRNAALAEAERDQARIGAEFARSLQDLGFTYHEARAHVTRAVEPLIAEMLETFFPAQMREALGHTILQELVALAEAAADAPVGVSVAPPDADRMRALLGEETPVPLRIVEDATLASGQAYLRLGETERMIDLAGVIARTRTALEAVSDLNERSLAHG